MVAEKPQEKKFLGLDSGVIAVSGLFIAILGVVVVLATFAFNTLRADIARVETGISELRAEAVRLDEKIDRVDVKLSDKIDSVDARLSDKIDRVDDKIDSVDARLSDKIDNLADSIDSRLDEVEREQSRQQGAFDALRGSDR